MHYDTIDGRRVVEPSNKVCVYAPRFSSVRQVKGMFQHDFALPTGRIDDPVDVAYRVIADHVRCLTVAVSDGAWPSNDYAKEKPSWPMFRDFPLWVNW